MTIMIISQASMFRILFIDNADNFKIYMIVKIIQSYIVM